jgi:hypothetical protein
MNNPAPGPRVAPGILVRGERCEKCKFAQILPQNTNLECCRFPPQQTFILVPSQQGPRVERLAASPVVTPNQWCGEFRPRIDGVN